MRLRKKTVTVGFQYCNPSTDLVDTKMLFEMKIEMKNLRSAPSQICVRLRSMDKNFCERPESF